MQRGRATLQETLSECAFGGAEWGAEQGGERVGWWYTYRFEFEKGRQCSFPSHACAVSRRFRTSDHRP